MCVYFFFFKQKTAYEMRISDWSSDVCSSDLWLHPGCAQATDRTRLQGGPQSPDPDGALAGGHVHYPRHDPSSGSVREIHRHQQFVLVRRTRAQRGGGTFRAVAQAGRSGRSEEHTSELQALMRNSYAVFCLTK